MQSIVTITMNPALDRSTRVGRVVPEQKLSCDIPKHDPGGGGINVARAIHKMGGEAQAHYLSGGAIGMILQELLDREGVDHYPTSVAEATRANLTVLDESSGQQFRFGMPGPTVRADEWPRMLDMIRELEPRPAYVVAGGSLPPGVPDDFYARLADPVEETGARFVVDARGAPLREAVDRGVYLIKPNVRELGTLEGAKIEREQEQEATAKKLIEAGKTEVVVVSLGAAGALLVTEDVCTRIRAPSVRVVSKIGAGDSTVGGIVLALARGKPIVQAVRYGVAAGAAAVISPGTELCKLEDVERLYDKISNNETAESQG